MNYRHLYHAGNFADVIKHIVLIALLQALQRKETPFCFLDTHAGIGLYPLQSVEAQKKQEYQTGIEKLFLAEKNNIPKLIQDYLSIITEFNYETLNYYPGSPVIAEKCIRDRDQIILCELHPMDCQTLKNNLSGDHRIAVHHIDGYSGIKAFLPPKQKRGLVLIDPPFEIDNEFEKIIGAVQKINKHWRSGTTMIWYPIKNTAAVANFYHALNSLDVSHVIIEMSLNHIEDVGKLSSCGIIVINPLWQTKETINAILPYLSNQLDAQITLIDRCK